MTENLLQKLEEKMMMLLSEVEELRGVVARMTSENTMLKSERESNTKKLQDLISLLDAVNSLETNMNNAAAAKPILLEAQAS